MKPDCKKTHFDVPKAQLNALLEKKEVEENDNELLMQHAKLLRKLKKLKKKEAKEKKKKKKSTKRPRSISDGEIDSEIDSKKRRSGSSSRRSRDNSPDDVQESVPSDIRNRTPRNRESSSDSTNSPSPDIEEITSKKIIDLRIKIKEKELERLTKYYIKRCNSVEALEKECDLKTPKERGSKDRQLRTRTESGGRYVSSKERVSDDCGYSSRESYHYGHSSKASDRYGNFSRDSKRHGHSSKDSNHYGHFSKGSDRYGHSSKDSDRYGNSSKDSDRYGHPSKDSDRYGHPSKDFDRYGHSSKDSKRYGHLSKDSDRYGHSSKDSSRYDHSSKDSDRYGHSSKDSDCYGHSIKESDRYGLSYKESHRSPMEQRSRYRSHDITVEREHRRRSSEDRGARVYELSSRGRDSEVKSLRGTVVKGQYPRSEDKNCGGSSILVYRKSSDLNDSGYRPSREMKFKSGYTNRNAIMKPESHSSIITDMNQRYQKLKEYRNKKEEQAHMIKQEEDLIHFKTDEAVKDILKDNFSVINEMANKHRATDAEKKLVLPLLFRAIKGRFKSLLITSDLMVNTIIARYRCKYTRRIDDDLVSSLFKEIILARDKDEDQEFHVTSHSKRASCDTADADNETDNMLLQQTQHVATDDGWPVKLEPADNNVKNVGFLKWTPVDNDEMVGAVIEEPPNTGNIQITIDEERRKKYYITIKTLLRQLKIHIVKYRKYIDQKTFAYVVRMILEERIDIILVNKSKKMRAKALFAYYRKIFLKENDEEFIRHLFYNTWNGVYNNVAESENDNNANANAPENNDNAHPNTLTDDIQAAVKTEPVAEEPSVTELSYVEATSKEPPSTNAPKIISYAEASSIKKEPIFDEIPISAVENVKTEKSNERDLVDCVTNVVIKAEHGTDVLISNNKQNKPADGIETPTPSTHEETDSRDNEKNKSDVIRKRFKIIMPVPAVVKIDVDKCLKTDQIPSMIPTPISPDELITDELFAYKTIQVKAEPSVEDSEKPNDTPVAKEEVKQIDGKNSEAAKSTISVPKPVIDIKPEVKQEIDDDDDIEFIGIEPSDESENDDNSNANVPKNKVNASENIDQADNTVPPSNSKESSSPNVPQILSNAEATSIKKEPKSLVVNDKTKQVNEMDLPDPVIKMVTNTELEMDVLISKEGQNKRKADGNKTLSTKEKTDSDSKKNQSEITRKRIKIVIPAVVKIDADKSLNTDKISDMISTPMSPDELITDELFADKTIQVEAEPSVEDSEKPNDTPFVKDEAEQAAEQADGNHSETAKSTISVPKPVIDIKPDDKPENDDGDDDIEFVGEYIDPNNESENDDNSNANVPKNKVNASENIDQADNTVPPSNSKESSSPNVPQILSNAEATSIKKEPKSLVVNDKTKQVNEMDLPDPVIKMVTNTELEMDVLISKEGQNKRKADGNKTLSTKEKTDSDSKKNQSEITRKRIKIVIPAVVKIDADKSLNTDKISDMISTPMSPDELITDELFADKTIQVEAEPSVEDSEKPNDTPFVKDEAEQAAEQADGNHSETAKSAISVPKPVIDIKPDDKPENDDDDDDIEFVGEYIDPNNGQQIGDSSTVEEFNVIQVSDDEENVANIQHNNSESIVLDQVPSNTMEEQCTHSAELNLDCQTFILKHGSLGSKTCVTQFAQNMDEIASRQQNIDLVDRRVGRTNFSPDRGKNSGTTDKPESSDKSEERKDSNARKNEKTDCKEEMKDRYYNVFEEDAESIEAIRNFLNTH